MRHSFRPFTRDEVLFLQMMTNVDYSTTDFTQPHWLCVTAYDDEGKLMGVCAFEFKTWFDAHMTVAILDPRCVTRRLLRAMFTAVFSQARRITVLVEANNLRSFVQVKRMGFQPEGLGRLMVEGTRDALILGMTAGDCRYLRVPRETPVRGGHHGVVTQSA
jgi:hypothetical protein